MDFMASSWVKNKSGWEISGKFIRVFVTDQHRDDPGTWVYSCPELDIRARPLNSRGKVPEDAEEAKVWAKSFVAQKLKAMLAELD